MIRELPHLINLPEGAVPEFPSNDNPDLFFDDFPLDLNPELELPVLDCNCIILFSFCGSHLSYEVRVIGTSPLSFISQLNKSILFVKKKYL